MLSIRKYLLFVTILFGYTSYGQNDDAIKITEARIALEKYRDCNNALEVLSEVSENGRKNPLYQLYAGKVCDCLEDYDGAIILYEQYLQSYPNARDILQRSAELRYAKRRKENRNKNLAGNWYLSNKPNSTHKLEQTENFIKLYDPSEAGDDAILFLGTFRKGYGDFIGGRYWRFEKQNRTDEYHAQCNSCTFLDREYLKDEFSRRSTNDILKVSEDGNTITIEQKYPKVSAEQRSRVAFEGTTHIDFCICEINWSIRKIIYHRK